MRLMFTFANGCLPAVNIYYLIMSNLLKDIYSPAFFDRFADILAPLVPGFNKEQLLKNIFTDAFSGMELKQRMKHTTAVLHQILPADYPRAIEVITRLVDQLRTEKFGEYSLVFMFLPDYIETYGLDYYGPSVQALELVTQFITCEFAVRPFIIRYPQQMMLQMEQWALHKNHHVRRLATEGCRPRLPWAMALPALKKDPAAILPVLELLKNDPEEWVRRSVANNLNDIAKDNPDVVLAIAAKWKGISKEVDATIKHGCRTLLKQGHPEILRFYGLDGSKLVVSDFTVITPEVSMGDHLSFSFSVSNTAAVPQTLRLEYAIYYLKQNGQLSRKVFKISERSFGPGEQLHIRRRQSFKLITTRKFYEGVHAVAPVLNGQEHGQLAFTLRS